MRARRLSTRLVVSQLLVLVVALISGFFLFIRELRSDIHQEYEARALSIAEAAADMPAVRAAMAAGDPHHEVASLAESLRQATKAAYVVVIDRNGIRHSHPNPKLIGQKVEEPLVAMDGRGHYGIDHGSLGDSANGKAPLLAPDGRIIGEVSAGILERRVSDAVYGSLPTLTLYCGLALLVGAGASLLLARRLKRDTFGLELDEIAALLQEREAMLHGISEGVITLDLEGRVSLVNHRARRLLGIGSTAIGRTVDELLPPGRVRDLLSGARGDTVDETVLTDQYALVITRLPVEHGGRRLGAVVTVRDRTELAGLLRELNNTRSFTDALRAQQHEHANRMHALAGLLELGRYDEASSYLTEISSHAAGMAEMLRDRVGNPTLVALLLSKATIASERGVELAVTGDRDATPWEVDDIAVKPSTLVTVIGNLVDNAIDAAATGGSSHPHVDVRLVRGGPAEVEIVVSDNGAGVAEPDQVFRDGYTTKPARDGAPRGLGLALVHRLVVRAGGTIAVTNDGGAVFRVKLPTRHRAPAPTAGR